MQFLTNLTDKYQSGFRTNHSTKIEFLKRINDTTEDPSAAFKTIKHENQH